MQKLVEHFIQTTNAFDIEVALSLFPSDATIDNWMIALRSSGSI